MFNTLYKFWFGINDTPSVISKLNLWTFINLRVFKFKFVRNLFFFVIGLNKFKLNSILYNYRDWNFEQFFFKFFKLVLIISFILILI